MDTCLRGDVISGSRRLRHVTVSPYPLLLFAGIVISLIVWTGLAKRDERLLIIYVAALVSAFVGAKLVYLAAEGWMFWNHPQRWTILATGKTILGALLGGYLGVELAKKGIGYRQPTGDLFAVTVPIGIVLGRIGCLLHGCCPGRIWVPHWWTVRDASGVARWPSVSVEIGFNLVAAAVLLSLRARRAPGQAHWLPGQHFHLYLIAYGLFRFVHEYFRDTPRIAAGVSGYHLAALAAVGLGTVGFLRRQRPRLPGSAVA